MGAESDWTRLRKSDVGYTLGQFNPQLNPLGLIPRANFGGLPTTGGDGVDLNYPDRIGDTAVDYVASIRNTLTWARDKHTFKFGGYLEFMQNHESRGGNWAGQFTFNRNTANPLDSNYTYANALLGVFSEYTESSRPGDTFNRGVPLGVVRAGHVEADQSADHRLWRPLPVVHAVVAARQHHRRTSGRISTIRRRRRRCISRSSSTASAARVIRSPGNWERKCSSARSCRARAIRRTAWRSPASRA